MISTAAEYEYVTGDIDLIKIDGKIMPLRSASDKTLRGEDIAFLKEFIMQRRYAVSEFKKLDGTEYASLQPFPESTSINKSWFEKAISVGLFPYSDFSRFASNIKSQGSMLFTESDTNVSFSCAGILDQGEMANQIESKCKGKTFDISGLPNPSKGDRLLKTNIEKYFECASNIAGMGVGYTSPFRISFGTYQKSVETWSGSSSYPQSKIPNWGVLEYDFDYSETYGWSWYGHYYGHGYPSSGVDIISITAPHGDHAVAICVFIVTSTSVNASSTYSFATYFKTYTMSKNGTQFTLKSDVFASSGTTNEIIAASGVQFPADTSVHWKRASISMYVAPIVFFDDHTKWTQ